MPEYSNYLESRPQVADGDVDGDEIVGCSKDGDAAGLTSQKIANLAVTRDFNRAFVETLIFDKHEIFHAPIVMSAAVLLEIGPGGLIDQASCMRFRITADGVSPVSFGLGFDFLYGITNGQILDAGTYEFYMIYTNGSVSVMVPGATQASSSLTQLSAPGNFIAAADGETEIDLSWDAVANATEYHIEYSLDGSTGWTTLEDLTGTSTSQTSLTASSTRFYRIKAVGDGVSFADSGYSTASATTQDAGDVTPPTFTFLPASGNTSWAINRSIIITANEALHNDSTGILMTSANIASKITLKETNSGGANIPFTATIDVSGTIINVQVTNIYGANQLVYVAIDNVEDSQGNELAGPVSSTFTTTEFTIFDGIANYMRFGDTLDTVWAAVDTKFKLRITLNDQVLSGTRFLIGKYSASDNHRSFYWSYAGTDIFFTWAKVPSSAHRVIRWAGALSPGEHELEVAYDGSIDTNNGLDRCILKVDGVTAGSKTLYFNDGLVLGDIVNTTAQLSFAAGVNTSGAVNVPLYYAYEAKDLVILSGAGDTVEINVPLLRTGEDTSGNNRDAVWG